MKEHSHTFLSNNTNWCYEEETKQYYKEYCEENDIEYNANNVIDWALDEAQVNEEADWDNLKYSKVSQSKVKLVGKESNYHSWKGNHQVYDKVFDTLYNALSSIILDGNDKHYQVWLEKGKVHVTWSDHDSPCGGTHLVFKKLGGYFTLKEFGLA